MVHEQYLRCSEHYLLQEELGEIVDIRTVTRDLSDESDLQAASLSQQTPAGSSKDLPSSVAGMQAESEAERLRRKPHCEFQWEKKRQVQYPVEGELQDQSWARSRPTLLPPVHSAKVYRRIDAQAYVRNLMGTANVALECHIDRRLGEWISCSSQKNPTRLKMQHLWRSC